MPDLGKVDLIIQYSLLVAGENDSFYERQLGPIHLIKYVYLADLYYAQRNDGESFTGIPWSFYKFGPWSLQVNARIAPALHAIHAQSITQGSDYENQEDWTRWYLQDSDTYREKERNLPISVSLQLRQDIRKYGKDTTSLLHYVYNTRPMLFAAPNETLDLKLVASNPSSEASEEVALRASKISNKKLKLFSQKMAEIRSAHQQQKSQKETRIIPVATPRFDETYQSGMQWLDGLAGDYIPEGHISVQFDKDVWKSPTRNGEDVS